MRNFAVVAALCAALASPAFGTLTTTGTTVSYTANGATTAFSFPFRFFANSDLVVTVTDTSGAVFTKALGTDYSVTGANVSTGGTVTFNTAPTSGYVVKLTRLVPLTQTTSLRSVPTAPATESGLDKVMAIAQQLDAKIVNPVLPSVLTNATPVTATGGNTSLTLAEWLKQPCNVRTFGADPTAVADSAPAINAAIAACDEVYIPAGGYRIDSTILLNERSGEVIRGGGLRGFNNGTGLTGGLGTILIWNGNNTDPAIRVWGSADTTIRDLKVYAATAHPLDTGIRYETKLSRVNTHNALHDVHVTSDGILGSLHYGISFIVGTGGDANNDQGMFDYLTLGGYDTAGVNISHAQAVDNRFVNLIMGSNLGASTYGITAPTGATFSVYGGGGGGHFGADFNVLGSAFSPITISDFHTEGSAHFLITQGGTPTNSAGAVTLIGCSATDGAVAANGRVIDFETQGPLNLINFMSNFSTAKNKSIFYNATGLDTYGFNVLGLFFVTSATNAFSNFQPTFMTGVEVVNAGGVTGQRSKTTSSEILLTYSATIATDAGLGSSFRIDPTNGTAFTISFPTNGVKGQRLLYCIRNISGGALGVITWTSFKMAAFTNPANGSNRCIEFKFDGFNYYEIGRTTVDVPN